jgi:Spy/CpxP family protein refolding chaperone
MVAWFVGLMMTLTALSGQGVRPAKWWQSEDFQSRLHLSDQQVQRIDAIYDGTIAERTRNADEVERLNKDLRDLIDAPAATEEAVAALAAQVGAAQARQNKTRTLMLYRMHKVLTPEQRDLLRQLVEGRRGRISASHTGVRHP